LARNTRRPKGLSVWLLLVVTFSESKRPTNGLSSDGVNRVRSVGSWSHPAISSRGKCGGAGGPSWYGRYTRQPPRISPKAQRELVKPVSGGHEECRSPRSCAGPRASVTRGGRPLLTRTRSVGESGFRTQGVLPIILFRGLFTPVFFPFEFLSMTGFRGG